MALTFDVSECGAWVRSEQEWPITEALIFASMPLGYGSITESNAADVYAALAVYESLAGPILLEDGKPTRITPGMVQARIGLKTNAVNGKSPAARTGSPRAVSPTSPPPRSGTHDPNAHHHPPAHQRRDAAHL